VLSGRSFRGYNMCSFVYCLPIYLQFHYASHWKYKRKEIYLFKICCWYLSSLHFSYYSVFNFLQYYDIQKECVGSLCYDFSNMETFLSQKPVRDALVTGNIHHVVVLSMRPWSQTGWRIWRLVVLLCLKMVSNCWGMLVNMTSYVTGWVSAWSLRDYSQVQLICYQLSWSFLTVTSLNLLKEKTQKLNFLYLSVFLESEIKGIVVRNLI